MMSFSRYGEMKMQQSCGSLYSPAIAYGRQNVAASARVTLPCTRSFSLKVAASSHAWS